MLPRNGTTATGTVYRRFKFNGNAEPARATRIGAEIIAVGQGKRCAPPVPRFTPWMEGNEARIERDPSYTTKAGMSALHRSRCKLTG